LVYLLIVAIYMHASQKPILHFYPMPTNNPASWLLPEVKISFTHRTYRI
jgi:hypothetical protein